MSYSLKANNLNCYTIEYNKGAYKYYGNIVNFFTINQINCCVIQRFQEITDPTFECLDSLSKMHIIKFFVPVEILDTYDLIELTYIKRRCILSENRSEIGTKSIIISPCHSLNDHD